MNKDCTTKQESTVTVVSNGGVVRYHNGLQVSEHIETSELHRTGSEPKPMRHTGKVAKPET